MTTPSAHGPSTAAQWHQSALALIGQERTEDAMRALRRAVEIDPAFAPAWNDLGVLLEALGNRRDAIHCYRTALRAAPGMEEPLGNLLALAAQAAAQGVFPHPVGNRASRAVMRRGG